MFCIYMNESMFLFLVCDLAILSLELYYLNGNDN